ncbi:MAG TPA: multidrug effflux MFS transporter [Acidimicrobiia bacterium]|nr:multidrug effflux MFS transporter [Acidimicrobiia bacterium]
MEFTILISMIMAIVALAIDMMLPAFGEIRESFGLVEDSNQLAPIVTFFFIGLAVGQPFWGPLSDALGRKRILYWGLAVYVVGAIGAVWAPSLELLFLFRFIGGLGAAGPRVVALSVVRDVYEGEAMARALSFIMAVFLLVPIIAPTLGAVVLEVGRWQMVFWVMVVFAITVGVWSIRLPETLAPPDRVPLEFTRLRRAASMVLSTKTTMGFTLAQTAMFGFFTSFLASSQLIVDDVFDLGTWFPVIFAGSAALIGVAILMNTYWLTRFGLRRVIRTATVGHLAASLAFMMVIVVSDRTPSFTAFAIGFVPISLTYAMLIPNLNSAALAPMGAIAGTASAVIGATTLLGGSIIGSLVDRAYDGSVLPFGIAAGVLGIVAFILTTWAQQAWGDSVQPEPATARSS